MDFINPIFNHTEIINEQKSNLHQSPIKTYKRKTRSDKTHNVKFPVDSITQMKLKSFLRQTNRLYRLQGKEELKQTKFNTLLLQFALRHKEIIRFDHEYNDTKVYLHTTLLEMEYEREIGGPHGLAVRENLSERKVVFHIMMSVLHWIEGEGHLEKIL